MLRRYAEEFTDDHTTTSIRLITFDYYGGTRSTRRHHGGPFPTGVIFVTPSIGGKIRGKLGIGQPRK
jgi:hypothetical protein